MKLVSSLCLLALVAGCSSSTSSDDEVSVARSQALRESAPVVPAADAEALRAGNTAFAFDLYHSLTAATPTANLFYSPYSISLALAMTYAGARTTTETEMGKTLHFTLPQAQLHPAFDALDLALESRSVSRDPSNAGKELHVSIANSLWAAPTTSFEAPFLDTLAKSYGAGVRLTDFSNPGAAAKKINDWVSGETNAKITDLLSAEALESSPALVLVNATYFKGSWVTPFETSATVPGTFHARGGDVSASMMRKSENVKYGKGTGYQSVSIPYAGGLSFVAVLPDDDASFTLDAATWDAAIAGGTSQLVDLTMPKLTIKGATISLKDELEALGMSTAFGGSADFSGMTTKKPLEISDVLHQAFVSVDENGTEAAAATAVILGETVSIVDPPKPIPLTLDKPFTFVIRDDASGAILFLGHVAKL